MRELKALKSLRFGKIIEFLLRRMQQGLLPCKDDNEKRQNGSAPLVINKNKAHGLQLPHAYS